jgi:PleD family two-component response regulator
MGSRFDFGIVRLTPAVRTRKVAEQEAIAFHMHLHSRFHIRLEFSVSALPSKDICIRALKVGVNDYVARIRLEHPADI